MRMPQAVKFDELDPPTQLVFLTVACTDIDLAKEAAWYALSVKNLVEPKERQDQLARALADAAVIRYCRPFMFNNISDTHKTRLPHRFCGSLTMNQQYLHDEFMRMRNSAAAHSDFSEREVLMFRILPPDKLNPILTAKVAYEHASADELEGMIAIANHLHRALDKERRALAEVNPLDITFDTN